MKEFDLEKAKAGAAVCTRDGRDVRIICWDCKNKYSIIALVAHKDKCGELHEDVKSYTKKGELIMNNEVSSDLVMKSTNHEGWINIYPQFSHRTDSKRVAESEIYQTKEEALQGSYTGVLDTIKIEWKE